MSSVSSSSSSSSSLANSLASSTGLNSGLDINGIISKLMAIEHQPVDLMQQKEDTIKKQMSLYGQAQSMVQNLLNSIKTLTKRDVATNASIFDNMSTTSSNTSIVTASATNTAASQTISVEVQKLPSLTTATSTAGVGAFNNSTTVDQLGITPGNFTVYANGTAYSIAVSAGETMGQVFTAINTAVPDGAISADPTIVDGKTTITYQAGANISLGSGGDTSNFLQITNVPGGQDAAAGKAPELLSLLWGRRNPNMAGFLLLLWLSPGFGQTRVYLQEMPQISAEWRNVERLTPERAQMSATFLQFVPK